MTFIWHDKFIIHNQGVKRLIMMQEHFSIAGGLEEREGLGVS